MACRTDSSLRSLSWVLTAGVRAHGCTVDHCLRFGHGARSSPGPLPPLPASGAFFSRQAYPVEAKVMDALSVTGCILIGTPTRQEADHPQLAWAPRLAPKGCARHERRRMATCPKQSSPKVTRHQSKLPDKPPRATDAPLRGRKPGWCARTARFRPAMATGNDNGQQGKAKSKFLDDAGYSSVWYRDGGRVDGISQSRPVLYKHGRSLHDGPWLLFSRSRTRVSFRGLRTWRTSVRVASPRRVCLPDDGAVPCLHVHLVDLGVGVGPDNAADAHEEAGNREWLVSKVSCARAR